MSLSLTPEAIRTVVFKRSAMGRRGYDEDEVDSFLDMIEVELGLLIAQSGARERDDPRPSSLTAGPTATTDERKHAVRLLNAAEETADRLIKQAGIDSEGMLGEAQKAVQDLVAEKEKLEQEIDSLRSYRSNVQRQLERWVRDQLRRLESDDFREVFDRSDALLLSAVNAV